MYQPPKCPYSYFWKRWSFIWGCFFAVSIIKKENIWKNCSKKKSFNKYPPHARLRDKKLKSKWPLCTRIWDILDDVEFKTNRVISWFISLPLCYGWTALKVSQEEGGYASRFYRWFWESFKELPFAYCDSANFKCHSFAQLLDWRSLELLSMTWQQRQLHSIISSV